MNQDLRNLESLLGVPDPYLIWKLKKQDVWEANFDKYLIVVSRGFTSFKPNHNFNWKIYNSSQRSSWKSLSEGSGHSLKEAKRSAQKGLRALYL